MVLANVVRRGAGRSSTWGVDAVVDVEVGDISDDPDLVTIQKHDLACFFVGKL